MNQPTTVQAKGSGLNITLADWPGAGKTIFAVHGIASNSHTWSIMAAALTPEHRLLAMDLRGRGLSDKPSTGYSIDHHLDDIAALLDDLGLERVAVMGHSLGAMIGLKLAARMPQVVERLILVDGGGKLSLQQTQKILTGIKPSLDRLGQVFSSTETYLGFIKANPLVHPWNQSLEDAYLYELEQVDGGVRSKVNPEHIAEEAANLANEDLSQYHGQVRCPTLILKAPIGLTGRDDIMLPDDVVAPMLTAMDQARCVEIEGTDHYSIMVQPNVQRDRVIREFLAE